MLFCRKYVFIAICLTLMSRYEEEFCMTLCVKHIKGGPKSSRVQDLPAEAQPRAPGDPGVSVPG